eukprot:Gb_25728 [translate_table: standard]
MVVKKLCVEDIDDNYRLCSIILVKEAICYATPQKSAKKSSDFPNLSSYFTVVTNQKCGLAFRAIKLEISPHNPAPNDNMSKDPCEEGLLESRKHDPDSVNHDDGQNVLMVGTLAVDLRGVNYDNPFVLTVGPIVIDTRVCDPRILTLGTMPVNTFVVDPDILNAEIVDDRGNIDADMHGHWNFNNKAMSQTPVIKSRALVNYSPRLSPTNVGDIDALIGDISALAERFQNIFMPTVLSETQTVLKDIVYEDLTHKPHRSEAGGQAYTAHLHSVELVAVKVQRLGMSLVLALDAHLIHMIGGQLKCFAKARGDLSDAVNEMVRHMLDEIDSILEAQNAKRFASLYGFDADFESCFQYCGLGQDVDKRRKMISSCDHNSKTKSWVKLLEEVSFHADLHIGNLVAIKEGLLAYYDFVMMGADIQQPIANALQASFEMASLEGMTKTSRPNFKVVASAYPLIIGILRSDPDLDVGNFLSELLIRNNGSIWWHRLEHLIIAITDQTSVTDKDSSLQNEMGQTEVRGWSLSFDIHALAATIIDIFDFSFLGKGLRVRILLARYVVKALNASLQHKIFGYLYPERSVEEAVADLLRILFSSPDIWHHEATKGGARLVHNEQITEVLNCRERNSIGLAPSS